MSGKEWATLTWPTKLHDLWALTSFLQAEITPSSCLNCLHVVYNKSSQEKSEQHSPGWRSSVTYFLPSKTLLWFTPRFPALPFGSGSQYKIIFSEHILQRLQGTWQGLPDLCSISIVQRIFTCGPDDMKVSSRHCVQHHMHVLLTSPCSQYFAYILEMFQCEPSSQLDVFNLHHDLPPFNTLVLRAYYLNGGFRLGEGNSFY